MGKSTHQSRRARIRAIPTWYAGYKFRSRIEARWAVFLSHAGVKWHYESQGIASGNGICYIPDFYLPDLDMVVEVKGKDPTDSEMHKLVMACDYYTPTSRSPGAIYTTGAILTSIPSLQQLDIGPTEYGWQLYDCNGQLDDGYAWCQCVECGYVGFEYMGFAGRLPCECVRKDDRIPAWNTPKLLAAYHAARKERFGT